MKMNQVIFYPESEFHGQRKIILGGSDIPLLMGLSPFGGRLKLFGQKTGIIAPTETNYAMRRGTHQEPFILGEYSSHHPDFIVDDCKVIDKDGTSLVGIIKHPTIKHAGFHPDGLALSIHNTSMEIDRGIEVKTTSMYDGWGPAGSDEIPEMYLLQVQWGMFCSGLNFFDVVVEIGGRDYREYTIPRSDKVIEIIEAAADKFVNYNLKKNIAPEPDGGKSDQEILRELYEVRERTIMSTPETEDAYNRLVEIDLQQKDLDEYKIMQQTIIQAVMKENTVMLGSDHKITWKEQDGNVSWKSTAKDLSDAAGLDLIKFGEENRGAPFRVLRKSKAKK